MQHCFDGSCNSLAASFPVCDGIESPCGYIVERIRSHWQERICFHGRIEICGLPPLLKTPLTLCRVDVAGIALQHGCCEGKQPALCIRLHCTVRDCCGCEACGEAQMPITLRNLPRCRDENFHLSARVNIHEAQFCSHCSFFLLAEVVLTLLTSGPARMAGRLPRGRSCPQLPLYPPPACGCGRKTRFFSRFEE